MGHEINSLVRELHLISLVIAVSPPKALTMTMSNTTTLAELYREEGRPYLNRLARKVRANPEYLYQLATKRARPSYDLALALVRADPRLTVESLLFKPNDKSKWHEPEPCTL